MRIVRSERISSGDNDRARRFGRSIGQYHGEVMVGVISSKGELLR
jgi:hypothetical protein